MNRGRNSSQNSKAKSAPLTAAQLIQLGQFRSEKCELREAREAFQQALQVAKDSGDLRTTMEALAGLMRLASEALDPEMIREIESELDFLMQKFPKQVPPMAWYCKGVVARHAGDIPAALRFIRRFLQAVRDEREQTLEPGKADENRARGLAMAAILYSYREERLKRARMIAETTLNRFEGRGFRGLNGVLLLLLGSIAEKRRNFDDAKRWFHAADGAFLGEHSWLYHLYVLYGHARIARKQRNFQEASLYLDLIEKAISGPEFGSLRREIEHEREQIRADSVDFVIDGRQGYVQASGGEKISLRKQYVLLHILEALACAHDLTGDDHERGLSKAEIIETVWNEKYRPEAHDNKLYYNINRLRKLIEQDPHRPRYLLNWKEGYRLAPGLKIQYTRTGAIELKGKGDTPTAMPGLRIQLSRATPEKEIVEG